MRVKQIEKSRVSLRLSEKPSVYTDEKVNQKLPLSAYYSEDGDLVEIVAENFLFEVMEKEDSDYKEIFIPDRLPIRKYIFTFGKENKTPKICADSYNELNWRFDKFEDEYRLIIQRVDEYEMDFFERMELRDALIKDWLEDWRFDLNPNVLESVYKNKKLYFWLSDEDYFPDSKEYFVDKIEEMLEFTNYKIEKVKNTDYGAIVSATGKHGKEEIVCYYGENDEDVIDDDKIKELIKKAKNKKSSLIADLELTEDAERYCEENEIKFQYFYELVAKYWLKRWRTTDEDVWDDPEYWDEVIGNIFG